MTPRYETTCYETSAMRVAQAYMDRWPGSFAYPAVMRRDVAYDVWGVRCKRLRRTERMHWLSQAEAEELD